ncbi:hypothetical protein NEOLEDRAFT_1148976 [Neolentinus lepideus HHB14362 ss-1]|uniref:Uncharacterized protein n=1 Tax=Neolentinus lepideus HHB14362 ss-1 TaxID=1314782 RepID=A0A165RJ52_9AGAM|nr:hypothetical protein NEOLEDRAFT_1148976 [Neolentinus lepideus HHB14362 ss-1]
MDPFYAYVKSTSYVKYFARLTPESYTHDGGINMANYVTIRDCAPQFLNKVFFTLLTNRDVPGASPILEQHITDHVSGTLFFIRAKVDHDQFWYLPNSPASNVYVSRTDRTLFRIDIANGEKNEGRGTIMVATDNITITSVSTEQDLPISSTGNKLELFSFGDLKGGFRVSTAREAVESEDERALVRTDAGESWAGELIYKRP